MDFFNRNSVYVPKRELKGTEVAVFKTSKGTIKVRLDCKEIGRAHV